MKMDADGDQECDLSGCLILERSGWYKEKESNGNNT